MEKQLSEHFESFDFHLKRIKSLFELRHDINFDKVSNEIYETENAQVGLFCFEFALFHFIKKLGLKPSFHIGHSLGELIAYICAEGVSLEHGVDLIYYRARAMQKSPEGSMMVLYLNQENAKKILTENSLLLEVAAINAPELTVVSGLENEILKLEQLKEYKMKRLNVKQGFHSYLMDEVLEQFLKDIEHIEFNDTKVPVVSSVTGEILQEIKAQYWVSQIREPTNFLKVCESLDLHKIKSIVEIGPDSTLSHLIKLNILDMNGVYPTQARHKSYESFLQFIRKVYMDGIRLNIRDIFYKRSYTFEETENTPFSDKEFTFDSEEQRDKVSLPNHLSSIEISQRIVGIVSEQLEIEKNQIDINMAIINLGADSLLLLNVLDTIKDEFGVSIAITDVFQELHNIKLIAEYVTKMIQLGEEELEKYVINTSVDEKKPISSIESRGVLGNFSSHLNSQNASEENEQKFLLNLIQTFNEKTKSSKKWSGEYRRYLSDNRVSAGFRPNLKEMIYPIVWKKAKGAYFWDLDDNKYTDFTMGFGVNLFGHSPNFINKEIKQQLELGMALGPQSHMAALVAEKFCKITGNERITFLNSGTEAVMTAIRLIRAKTKREKVVIFEGSYHGHFDGVLGRTNSKKETVPVAPGVPNSLISGLTVLEYGSISSLDYIRDNCHELAGIVVEPVQSRYPELQPKEFLQELRKITTQFGSALVFDEVITGLRVGARGAQGYFDVQADLSSYGKVLGGGMPIGAVAGKHEYLDFIDGGDWTFGDNSMPLNPLTFFAGTFCKHSLAMAASLAILKEIEANGKQIFETLNQKTEALANELNFFFESKKISLRIVHFSSLFRFKFSGNLDLLFYLFNLNGIYIWEGRNLFLSTAHSDEDIKFFIKKTKLVINQLIDNGYIKTGISGVEIISEKKMTRSNEILRRQFTHEHKRFQNMCLLGDTGALAAKLTVGIELLGQIDLLKLKEAVESVLNGHDSLKSYYDLEKTEIIFNQLEQVNVSLVDFIDLKDNEAALKAFLEGQAREVIDLEQKCLDVHIISLSPLDTKLTFSGHHISLDGLSLAMLSFDIANTYSYLIGTKKNLKLKETSFLDFLDHKLLSPGKLNSQKNYWVRQIDGYQEVLFQDKKFDGGRISIDLNPELSKKIKFYGYKNKSSLMNTMMLALVKVLRDKFDLYDFVIGVPIAGHVNISDSMVGNCVNILPFRLAHRADQENSDFIRELKNYQLESFKKSEVSYELIKDELGFDPVEVVLNVEPINELPKFGTLKADLITYPSFASEYPIYLNIMKIDQKINLTIDYQLSALSSESKAKEFIHTLLEKLEKIVL
jgi:glutamate-1-semialdehyde aminotransferase/malonyl CoA-acyl carrier protein transacylase/acyl carrier protein